MNKTLAFTASLLVTILVISSVPLYLYLNSPQVAGNVGLNKFSSYDELKSFLETTSYAPDSYGIERSGSFLATEDASNQLAPSDESSYSKTNIQVEGVDEADIVKTDGTYIYVVSGGNVTIVKAYPPEEAQILSRITLDGTVTGIFINENKLIIFEDNYSTYLLYDGLEIRDDAMPESPEYSKTITYEPPTTSIKVYDISDRTTPSLVRDFQIDGNYFSSRMIGDYVYVVATMYSYYTATDIALPRIQLYNETQTIPATDIYYCSFCDQSYTFTTIVALNTQNDQQEPAHETILLGATSTIYVSQNNIYLTFPDYSIQVGSTETTIQRIGINKQTITFEATGAVPGYILNQFSMDEHNNHFRIATTVYNYGQRTFAEEATTKNNVYVLNMNLTVVGALENLAPGEQIYSTRFMGDRGYVVTFRNIDPLFVIDLSDPTAPTVLGALKVTGYSGYLHPYDETHIIGIGKETDYDSEADFAWYQGVKISLFDVSDVSNPVEVAKYEIGDRGTDSPLLHDHKALLFDKEKNLLVMPVLVAELDPSQYPGEVPDWAYGEYVWQGAYVFDISPDGITLRGTISHIDDYSQINSNCYRIFGYYGTYTVQRSLYIEDVLYTVSSMKIKMNNLDTLAEINQIEIA